MSHMLIWHLDYHIYFRWWHRYHSWGNTRNESWTESCESSVGLLTLDTSTSLRQTKPVWKWGCNHCPWVSEIILWIMRHLINEIPENIVVRPAQLDARSTRTRFWSAPHPATLFHIHWSANLYLQWKHGQHLRHSITQSVWVVMEDLLWSWGALRHSDSSWMASVHVGLTILQKQLQARDFGSI